MKKFIAISAFATLAGFASCGASINISHSELLKYQEEGFQLNLNSDPIDIKYLFLDNRNISKITKNRKRKTVEILQKNTASKFTDFGELNESKNEISKFALIIIDGNILEEKDFKVIEIENTILKDTTTLKQRTWNEKFDRQIDGDVLIITTSNKR